MPLVEDIKVKRKIFISFYIQFVVFLIIGFGHNRLGRRYLKYDNIKNSATHFILLSIRKSS